MPFSAERVSFENPSGCIDSRRNERVVPLGAKSTRKKRKKLKSPARLSFFSEGNNHKRSGKAGSTNNETLKFFRSRLEVRDARNHYVTYRLTDGWLGHETDVLHPSRLLKNGAGGFSCSDFYDCFHGFTCLVRDPSQRPFAPTL